MRQDFFQHPVSHCSFRGVRASFATFRMHAMIIIVPLASASLYAFGSLFLKQGLQNGAGAVRSLFLGNFIMTLCFLPTLALSQEVPDWDMVCWPVIIGICFFCGQAFTVWAIKSGDVSVQTPLMGTKVVFVAAWTMFLSPDPIRPILWVSAGLTAIAVFLLGQSNEINYRSVRKAIILSLISCVFFGATDSLVAARSELFGRIPTMIGMMLTLSVCSLFLMPFVQKPIFEFSPGAAGAMCMGSLFIGLQALILNFGLSYLGEATTINVIYSSRGLFGILLVWFLGKQFSNREREHAGDRIMRFRLTGASLMMLAIALIFV